MSTTESRAANQNSDSSGWRSKKNSVGSLVLGALVALGMLIVNLPYQYVNVGDETIGSIRYSAGTSSRNADLPTMAGWPFRYWVQYEDGHGDGNRYWSLAFLLFNVAITMAVVLAMLGYLRLRQRLARESRYGPLMDIGIALAILAVPCGIVAYDYVNWRKHKELIASAGNRGKAVVSCWLPDLIADQVPVNWRRFKTRIRHFVLVRPNDDLVKTIVSIPTLQGLQIVGGNFKSETLRPLQQNPHFVALRINRLDLGEADLDLINRLPWLLALDLSLTNLDASLLHRLDRLDKLRAVDVRYTPLDISKIGKPVWAPSVEALFLSRPRRFGNQIEIDGWPRLRQLSIRYRSIELNNQTLKIRLANLPNLEVVELDRTQKHDLTFDNLPRLISIQEEDPSGQQFFDSGMQVPGLTWVSNLNIRQTPSLRSLGVFTRNLNEFSIQDSNSLNELHLGSFTNGNPIRRSRALPDRENSGDLIQAVGKLDGPSSLKLSLLPLANVDLSALVKNQGIRHIKVEGSDITFKQVRQLEGMKQLETLDMPSCSLENDELSWVIEQFPRLKQLNIKGTDLNRIDIEGDLSLRSIVTSSLEQLQSLRIVDQPLLEIQLRVSRTLDHFEIRGCSSIDGLAMESEWPKEFTIDGLQSLKFFAAGGRHVDGSLLASISNCIKLNQLTLAYASLSTEDLRSINQFHRLSMLALPGAPLDDSITKDWSNLSSLWEVNFADTNISTGTLAWLASIGSLRRMSLDRVPLEDSKVTEDVLAELSQLSDLSFAGVPISPTRLNGLLSFGNLERLNLSQTQIDDETVELLCKAKSLRFLILHDCEIEASSVEKLLDTNRKLFIDIGSDPSVNITAANVLSGPTSVQHPNWNEFDNVSDRNTRHQRARSLGIASGFVMRSYSAGRIAVDRFRRQAASPK